MTLNGIETPLKPGDLALVSKIGGVAESLAFNRNGEDLYWNHGSPEKLFRNKADCFEARQMIQDTTGLRFEMLKIEGPTGVVVVSRLSPDTCSNLADKARIITYRLIYDRLVPG